jgi:hypothetical protein
MRNNAGMSRREAFLLSPRGGTVLREVVLMADAKQMDPSRTALSKALGERDAAANRVAGCQAAIDRVENSLHEAWRREREARARTSEEEAVRVERIIAGGSAVLERKAHARATEIEAEIAATKEARELCRGALREAERALDFAEHKVADAIGTVLAGAAAQLIKACEAAKADFTARAATPRFIRSALSDQCRRRV